MNRIIGGFFLVATSLMVIYSCKKDQPQVSDIPVPESPVSADLLNVPYDSLSQYGFFIGDMKNQIPAEGVIEYKPASKLFTDYAHKKRFVWMPGNMQAKYTGDHSVLDFPIGTVLIKNFYYEKIQPGDEFEYTSGTPLKTSSGLMHGSYQMQDFKGKMFEVLIPPFSLDIPDNEKKFN